MNSVSKLSEFTEKEFQTALDLCYSSLTQNYSPVASPKAYILGGQSGAGKTTIHDIIRENDTNVISIDGDTFRSIHPHFDEIQQLYGSEAANYTQAFSNRMVNKLVEQLSDEKYNLIIEGTCRTAEIPLKTCEKLKSKGYKTELDVICEDKTVSWQGTIDRYNEMMNNGFAPRAVPVDKYIEIVQALPKSVSEIYKQHLFDEICLYNRDKQCLYKMSETPNLNPASIVEHKLHQKPVSMEEMRRIAEKSISQLQETPTANLVQNDMGLKSQSKKNNIPHVISQSAVAISIKTNDLRYPKRLAESKAVTTRSPKAAQQAAPEQRKSVFAEIESIKAEQKEKQSQFPEKNPPKRNKNNDISI